MNPVRHGATPRASFKPAQPDTAHTTPNTRRKQAVAAATVLALLAGCGGGGGDSGSPVTSPTALGISSSNRDDVARSAAAALIGLSMPDAIDTVLPAVAAGDRARTLGSAWWPRQVLAAVQAALNGPHIGRQRALSATEGQARAQAVLGPFTDNCAVSGTMISTWNDADNTGSLTAGDQVTVAYNSCRMDPDTTLNGQFEVRYSSVTLGNTPTVVATMTMSNFATTEGSDQLTINGRIRMEHVQRSSVLQETTMTAETDVTSQARVAGRSDTQTFQAGFSTLSVVQSDALPPEGGFPGRLSLTSQGTVQSSALGGSFVLSTPVPLVAYFVDDYPRSGNALVTGRNSSLRMTAVSATQVRLDLDSNGDGTVDSSSTVAWSSLY